MYDLLLCQNKPSDKIKLYCYQQFTNTSKINHTKKVIEDLSVFRKYFRVRQEVGDEINTIIYFIKYDLQTSTENNMSYKKRKKKPFWLNWDGLKQFLTLNPMEKYITKMNTTPENIKYLVDNNCFMCQHNKLHPLTSRRGKYISETRYRDIEK